jgi:hypothetical protein
VEDKINQGWGGMQGNYAQRNSQLAVGSRQRADKYLAANQELLPADFAARRVC